MSGYFDANATTPLFPAVRDRYVEALDRSWQNASSLHHAGGAVRRLLDEAREELAEALGMESPRRIVFLSGATESANLVFRHAAATAPPGAKVLLSPLEHPCVRETASTAFPGKVIGAPLDGRGIVSVERIAELLVEHRPVLVSVMAANNETGALQPWREIRELCRERAIPFHCDAAQWLGKLAAEDLGGIDWLTGSGHKFGGPKGVGFLAVPENLERLHGGPVGGGQESGRRAGTENAPGIVAMTMALQEAARRGAGTNADGRDAFEARVLDAIPGTRVVGGSGPRLWNTSMLVVPAFSNLSWLTRLSHLGFQVSTGSACSAGKDNPSHVMAAMGLDHEAMGRVLRFSSLWDTTKEDWAALAEALESVWEDLRQPSGEARGKRKIVLGS